MNRRKRRAEDSGLTLLEAALAIGLLGLVATAAFTAAAAGLQAWRDGREETAADRRNANWNDRLHAAIAAMVPMAALTGAPPGARRAFFQGDAHGMRFVTAHSPSAGGRAGVRLVELRARDAGSGAELVLREAPCPTAVVLGELLGDASWAVRPETEDAWPGGHLRMVASRPLATWKFEYLSEPAGPRQRREWVARWEDRGTIPRAVRIEWVEERPAGGAGRKRTVTGAVIGATRASGEIGR